MTGSIEKLTVNEASDASNASDAPVVEMTTEPAAIAASAPAENAGVKMMRLAKEKAETLGVVAPQVHDEDSAKHIDMFAKVFAATIQDAGEELERSDGTKVTSLKDEYIPMVKEFLLAPEQAPAVGHLRYVTDPKGSNVNGLYGFDKSRRSTNGFLEWVNHGIGVRRPGQEAKAPSKTKRTAVASSSAGRNKKPRAATTNHTNINDNNIRAWNVVADNKLIVTKVANREDNTNEEMVDEAITFNRKFKGWKVGIHADVIKFTEDVVKRVSSVEDADATASPSDAVEA
jgi:hypothetical protein